MVFNMASETSGGGSSGIVFPAFTYTGMYALADEGMNGNHQNYVIRFLTSGTLMFSDLGRCSSFDLFLCGGGAAGVRGTAKTHDGGAGGGGGYTRTQSGIANIAVNTPYQITVGAGGTARNDWRSEGTGGGASYAFGYAANGGSDRNGGSGGGAPARNNGQMDGRGGNGGQNGGNGGLGNMNGTGGYESGGGQGNSTREFGEAGRRMYGCGGSGSGGYRASSNYGYAGNVYSAYDGIVYAGTGAGHKTSATSAGANTGGGGGGANGSTSSEASWGWMPGNGGSGIVCLRNHR